MLLWIIKIFDMILSEKEEVKEYMKDVLKTEQKHLPEYYACIGSDATSNIVEGLLEY